jgi:hypothetical protein
MCTPLPSPVNDKTTNYKRYNRSSAEISQKPSPLPVWVLLGREKDLILRNTKNLHLISDINLLDARLLDAQTRLSEWKKSIIIKHPNITIAWNILAAATLKVERKIKARKEYLDLSRIIQQENKE